MSRVALAFCLTLALALPSVACDGDRSSEAVDTVGSDANTVGSDADTASSGDFACGALATCDERQACASRGQGACVGLAPDQDGQCAPNCAPYHCGGADRCICDTYWCADLPTGCTTCSCAVAPDASCLCDDADGHVRFSCMGA